jgi:hypothetical protein
MMEEREGATMPAVQSRVLHVDCGTGVSVVLVKEQQDDVQWWAMY